MAVASLVLGIVGLVLFWFPGVNVVTLILSIVGVVLAGNATKQLRAEQKPTGVATAGLVLCIIGIVFSAIGVITCTICPTCVACAAGDAAAEMAEAASWAYKLY
ncbi:MAG: DUF4190 domain-containing protein [Clostridia bacterium]|nr:DUF4190 domain-containing protein [Clostridia bacterium]